MNGWQFIDTMEEFKRSRFVGRHLPPPNLRPHIEIQSKCPSATSLDVQCPCEGSDNCISKLQLKDGIVLVIVLAKTFTIWLGQLTKLVDFDDRKVMQLRVFYAHGTNRYKGVNAEPLINVNSHLLQCTSDGMARPG